jgi:PAS domain S-box-containing protein/diguanylate cyclase (GGDEF)-like protein
MALLSVDPSGETVIAEANRAMAKLTGYEPVELVGRSLADLTEPEDAEIDAELMAQLLAGRIPSYEIDKRFRGADGDLFWGELSVALIRSEEEGRQPLYLVVQLADVTERKRVDDAFQVSHDRLVSIFDEAPVGMALATLDCRWVQVNHALCQLLGHDEAALLRKPMTDLIVPEDAELVHRYLKQLRSGEVLGYNLETRAVRAGAHPIWIQLSVSLVHDYNGNPAYVFAEVQDVTERKRAEDELEQGMLLDAATGLPSRTLLFDRLEQAGSRLARTGTPFSVMFAEVVGLDVVAAERGQQRTQAALRELSARLLSAVRSGDTVARYGPDEFVIVCEDLESNDEAGAIAQRLVELAQFSVGGGDPEIDLALTLGLTVAAAGDDAPAALVERADAAMQTAKARGEAYLEFSDSL